ncbi:hypothetical protein DFP72DRAFT_755879, partial [Ephemerocybe angulata]
GTSSGSGGSSSSSGSGSSSSSRGSGSINSGGVSRGISTGSPGIQTTSTVPSGQMFGGRTVGGGMRNGVYGSRTYGSGYPGNNTTTTGKGTTGRNFPYFFWPLTFGAGTASYVYHSDSEYGRPDNSSRPGGPLYTASFQGQAANETFRVLSDNSTMDSLADSLAQYCAIYIRARSGATPYSGANTSSPKPEEVIQYYRASSVALSLDGYNNSAVFTDDESAPDTPLPPLLNMELLNCLNQSIGAHVPLVGEYSTAADGPGLGNSATRVQVD